MRLTLPATVARGFTGLLAAALCAAPFAESAGADDDVGLDALRDLHEEVAHRLEDVSAETPFYLQAESRHRVETGEAALYLPGSFDELSSALSEIATWCDILPLHLNVKACTFEAKGGESLLSVYVGRKFYQDPDDAFPIEYRFSSEGSAGYLRVMLWADEGPLGTSDYSIEFEAMPVEGKTFGRIQISEQQSWLSSKAMDAYFATKGAGKQGLTIIGHDESGEPLYTTGEHAAIERNVLRYYFAVVAHFEAMGDSPEERYHSSLEHWFAATEHYPQLYELDRDEYLEGKRRERQNQRQLQKELVGAGS